MRYVDGSSYTGKFVNGVRKGYGVLSLPDGSSYEGQWKQDNQHGKGKLVTASGEVKEGKWFKGQMLDQSPVAGKSPKENAFS